MTPKVVPICFECHKTETLLWRTLEQGEICQECYEQRENSEKANTHAEDAKETEEKAKDNKEKETPENKPTTAEEKRLRKSTREDRDLKHSGHEPCTTNFLLYYYIMATRFKARATAAVATSSANGGNSNTTSGGGGGGGKAQNKGRNRRNLFKKTPFKTPAAQATTHTVENVFYKGTYMQVGDIVSLVDNEDNVYYAQIRGLLVDNYCEKSAFLTWLIPTQASPDPRDGFDAATYLIGPDEELSRKLSCLEFVMHAPSNYYLDRTTPFPLPDAMEFENKSGGYIWTTLPEYQRKKAAT